VAGNLGRAYVCRAAAYEALGRASDALGDYRRILADYPYLLNDDQRLQAERLLGAKA
jgi:hypothetical protein